MRYIAGNVSTVTSKLDRTVASVLKCVRGNPFSTNKGDDEKWARKFSPAFGFNYVRELEIYVAFLDLFYTCITPTTSV